MRGLKTTLFVLGLLALSTQTFRHIYVKWIEPTGSVLDEFREPVEEDIAKSKDLDELKAMYKTAHERVEAYEKDNPKIKVEDRSAYQLYEDQREIESAIQQVEGQRKTIFEMWYFWICGLLSIGVGLLAYHRFNRWLGMVGIIAGFAEMVFMTSPLWRSWGPQGEFERLLTWKLVLSIVSMALLITMWLKSEKGAGAQDA